MNICEILKEETIIDNLKAQDKNSVLKELAEGICAGHPELNSDQIEEILRTREKLGSTGIGNGVAIPHGKMTPLNQIVAGFGRSPQGIDFEAQDGEATRLFFVLIAPEDSAGLHLKALAKLSRLLKTHSFRDKLLGATSREEIFRIIQEEDRKDV